MDEFTYGDLPENPLWSPGTIAVGSRKYVSENRITSSGTDEENAIGEVLRAERIRLWRDNVQGRLCAEARAEQLEAEVARLRDRVEKLQERLRRRD